jgi:hypothetical protein
LSSIARKPTEYPDAMPRKKRVLEVLPIAPPLPPREPTAAELEQQAQSDARIREYLKFRLGPVIAELRKRNKKFCKPIGDGGEIEVISPVNAEHPVNAEAGDAAASELPSGDAAASELPSGDAIPLAGEAEPEARADALPMAVGGPVPPTTASTTAPSDAMDTQEESATTAASQAPDPTQPMLATTSTETGPEGQMQEQAQLALPMVPARPVMYTFRFHDISLDTVHERLFQDRYHTPEMMLADIQRIVENAYHEGDPDTLNKADQMLNYARIMCDQACDPAFRIECQRMAQRERERAKKRQQARQKARENAAIEAEKKAEDAKAKEGIVELGAPPLTKRPREDGEQDGDDGEHAKRARFAEDVEMAGQASPSASKAPASTSAEACVVAAPAPTATAATSTSGVTSTSAPAATASSDPFTAVTTPTTKLPSPPPEEPLPDFILPETSLQDLGRFLVSQTGDLTVDELEQLRAACYDCIWRSRKEWNKTNLIKEIKELAEEYVTELEESKRE